MNLDGNLSQSQTPALLGSDGSSHLPVLVPYTGSRAIKLNCCTGWQMAAFFERIRTFWLGVSEHLSPIQ